MQKIKTIIKYLAESVADNDYLGEKEWANKLFIKATELSSNEWEISKIKFLDNGCEKSEGVGSRCEIQPVDDFEKIIEYFNSVYHDYVYDKLFNYKVYDNVIVLWGTSYLLNFNGEKLGIDDPFDASEEEILKKLKENNVPKALHELILYEDQITVADIVEKVLMKPGTSAEFEITDQEYGNDKIDLEA